MLLKRSANEGRDAALPLTATKTLSPTKSAYHMFSSSLWSPVCRSPLELLPRSGDQLVRRLKLVVAGPQRLHPPPPPVVCGLFSPLYNT